MPRPPILPVPDRSAIFASGRSWEEWLAHPDEPEQGERLRAVLDEVELPAYVCGALAAIERPVNIIAIAESWCGDVIRHAPVLARMCEASTNVHLRFVSREQYPDFFARFLTNGGEAIPKFVFCNDAFVETGHWGPMPAITRHWISQGKACDDVKGARRKVAAFYELDRHETTIGELLEQILIAAFPGFGQEG